MSTLFTPQPKNRHSHKFAFVHKCELPIEADELLNAPAPYDNFFYKIIYRLRYLITIYECYESRQYFRSSASIQREKVRHLSNRKHSYIIHPFSKIVHREKAIIVITWLFLFLYHPMFGSFFINAYLKRTNSTQRIVLCAISAVYMTILLADIIMRFFRGYTIPQTREIVLDHKRIVKNYLLTYFLPDFLPVLSFFILLPMKKDQFKYKLLVYQMTILRQFRLASCLQGVDEFLKWLKFKRSHRLIILLFLMCFLLLHWFTCFLRFIHVFCDEFGYSYDDSWFKSLELERQRAALLSLSDYEQITYIRQGFRNYFQYLNFMLCHFAGASKGYYMTHNTMEMCYLALFIVFSMTTYLVCIGILLQYYGIADNSELKFEEVLNQVKEYTVMKKFSYPLRKRIRKYYEYKFNGRFFSEKAILKTLTEHLRMEIILYSCEHMITRVQLFRGLSKAAVGCIVAVLKQEIYLAGEVIISAEKSTDTLYFILYGTCAILLSTGKEAMHIEDGSLFGENQQIKSKPSSFAYSVMAIEPCEIYSMQSDDIKYCCQNYPEIKSKLEHLSIFKEQIYTKALAKAALDDQRISASDIAAELRKGRILEQRRHRLSAYEDTTV